MSIPLTINGAVFEYPVDFDENWGVDATGWAQAVTNGMLQMAGGSFPLTADVNFGPNFGLLSKYFETRSSLPATTGTVRLSSADAGIAWRNFTNTGNNILTTDGANNLQYNGSTISGGVNAGTQYKLAYYATTSNNVSPNPNTTAATQVLVTDANGVPTTTGNGGTTATEIGRVSGVTSPIQTQLNAKVNLAGPNAITGVNTFSGGAGAITLSGSTIAMGTGAITGSGNITFSPTTAGIIGTTTNDAAPTGTVGEYVESVVSGVNLPASGVTGDATSISLTAGDWELTCTMSAQNAGGTWSEVYAGISTTSGNSQAGLTLGSNYMGAIFASTSTAVVRVPIVVPPYRFSFASTTTVYLKFLVQKTAGTPTCDALRISARRIR